MSKMIFTTSCEPDEYLGEQRHTVTAEIDDGELVVSFPDHDVEKEMLVESMRGRRNSLSMCTRYYERLMNGDTGFLVEHAAMQGRPDIAQWAIENTDPSNTSLTAALTRAIENDFPDIVRMIVEETDIQPGMANAMVVAAHAPHMTDIIYGRLGTLCKRSMFSEAVKYGQKDAIRHISKYESENPGYLTPYDVKGEFLNAYSNDRFDIARMISDGLGHIMLARETEDKWAERSHPHPVVEDLHNVLKNYLVHRSMFRVPRLSVEGAKLLLDAGAPVVLDRSRFALKGKSDILQAYEERFDKIEADPTPVQLEILDLLRERRDQQAAGDY